MVLWYISCFYILEPCVATKDYVRTMDNVTYSYAPATCWTLMSGHCAQNPSYAVFTKQASGQKLQMKAYVGGHKIEINGPSIKINDAEKSGEIQTNGRQFVHKFNGDEIFS